jgi:hypothetical protein
MNGFSQTKVDLLLNGISLLYAVNLKVFSFQVIVIIFTSTFSQVLGILIKLNTKPNTIGYPRSLL